MPTRKRKTKAPKPEGRKTYTGFKEHADHRCEPKKWAERLAVIAELDAVALRAVGEHMTLGAFQHACMTAWNNAHARIATMISTDESGDPPDDDEEAPKKKVLQ